MTDTRKNDERSSAAHSSTPPESVVGGANWNTLSRAAVVGGAIAATAGAYLGTRALARRNSGANGKVNAVMAAAITACDVAQDKSAPTGAPTGSKPSTGSRS